MTTLFSNKKKRNDRYCATLPMSDWKNFRETPLTYNIAIASHYQSNIGKSSTKHLLHIMYNNLNLYYFTKKK